MDSEIEVIGELLEGLKGLDPAEQVRVINYGRRFVRDELNKKGKALDKAESELPEKDLEEPEETRI